MPFPGQMEDAAPRRPAAPRKTLRRLLGYLDRRAMAVVLVCLLLSVFCSLAGSYQIRSIVNRFIWPGNRDWAGLSRAVALLLLLHLAGAAAMYVQSSITVRAAQAAVRRLRGDMFARLRRLPLAYFDRQPHGELMSRFTNDADNVRQLLEQGMTSLIGGCAMLLGLLALMLYVNWRLFLLTMPVFFLLLFLLRRFGRQGEQRFRSQQAQLGRLNSGIQECMDRHALLKLYAAEGTARTYFAAQNRAYREAAERAGFGASVLVPLFGCLTDLNYALVAVAGVALSIRSGFDAGGLIVFLNNCRQLNRPMNEISQQIAQLLSALAGAERMFALLDAEPETDSGTATLVEASLRGDGTLAEDGPGQIVSAWRVMDGCGVEAVPLGGGRWAWRDAGGKLRPIRGAAGRGKDCFLCQALGDVEFDSVCFGYRRGKPVLRGLSFSVAGGERAALVGATGAGKTTAVLLLLRFYEPEQGRILLDGLDLRDIRKEVLRRACGAVMQEGHLFDGSVLDNIRIGRPEASDEDCAAAARLANAHLFLHRLPDGERTAVREGVLSAGERQMIAIARAALSAPMVLLLDEATASVDSRTELLIRRGMEALMAGRTVLTIAHRLATVRNADRILVLEDGQITEQGTHETLLAAKGAYARFYAANRSGDMDGEGADR